jgi:hypothetical protein
VKGSSIIHRLGSLDQFPVLSSACKCDSRMHVGRDCHINANLCYNGCSSCEGRSTAAPCPLAAFPGERPMLCNDLVRPESNTSDPRLAAPSPPPPSTGIEFTNKFSRVLGTRRQCTSRGRHGDAMDEPSSSVSEHASSGKDALPLGSSVDLTRHPICTRMPAVGPGWESIARDRKTPLGKSGSWCGPFQSRVSVAPSREGGGAVPGPGGRQGICGHRDLTFRVSHREAR